MGRKNESDEIKLLRLCSKLPSNYSVVNGKWIFCDTCGEAFTAKRKNVFVKHLQTKKHVHFLTKTNESFATSSEEVLKKPTKQKMADLVDRALLKSDTLLYKLRNGSFQNMLLGLCNQSVSESYVRSYVDGWFSELKGIIKEKITGKQFYLIIDETRCKKN